MGNPPVSSRFPSQRASNMDIWLLQCDQPEPTFQQTVKFLVVWCALLLMWHRCNVIRNFQGQQTILKIISASTFNYFLRAVSTGTDRGKQPNQMPQWWKPTSFLGNNNCQQVKLCCDVVMQSKCIKLDKGSQKKIWAPSHIKTVFSRYGDSHDKDKMVVRPSYL